MRIAFGTDATTALTQHLVQRLSDAGHQVLVVADPAEWPDAGRGVGASVAKGAADLGIVCCWTGTGVSIAANKVDGVRAALCTDAYTADGARRWNDANVLAIGLRLTSQQSADEMVDAFLSGAPEASQAANIAAVEGGRTGA